jgi:hypothetical protein
MSISSISWDVPAGISLQSSGSTWFGSPAPGRVAIRRLLSVVALVDIIGHFRFAFSGFSPDLSIGYAESFPSWPVWPQGESVMRPACSGLPLVMEVLASTVERLAHHSGGMVVKDGAKFVFIDELYNGGHEPLDRIFGRSQQT